ncbi:MAG: alpha/beta-hydrolase family protein [Acidimicrobiales bacterium]
MTQPKWAAAVAAMRAAGGSRAGLWILNRAPTFTGSPSQALETAMFLDAYQPSLMPRSSLHQGLAVGLNGLSAKIISGTTEQIVGAVVPAGAALPIRLAVRGASIATGRALERRAATDQGDSTDLIIDVVGAGGSLLRKAAMSGMLYDVLAELRTRSPDRGNVDTLVWRGLATAGIALWASQRLGERHRKIERWPIEQYGTVAESVGVGVGVFGITSVLSSGYRRTRRALISYMGPGVTKNTLGRAANVGIWSIGAVTTYNALIAYIGRANEKVEPGYSVPPRSPLASGGPDSLSAFAELGLQGRRFVSHIVPTDRIEEVMAEPALAEPIRTYIGFNTEPVYPTGRAELALDELARTGAFDRSTLLLIAPTGTGWVDHAVVEAAEFLSRGDIATCCIQYGRYPSPLSIQKLAIGRSQFRLLLWGVNQRLLERPPDRRPRVLVFGESLGAWATSDVLMHQGIAGFDHYGIDRAMWFGLPGMAKWSRNGMARGSNRLVPSGTIRVCDTPDDLAQMTASEQADLRAVLLSHDNDPIAVMDPAMAVRRPAWLGSSRGRGVPEGMTWQPVTTFWQVVVDAANAMVTVPGEFRSFGHDYRADTARIVQLGFRLPEPDPEQMERIEAALRLIETERAERIKQTWEDVGREEPPLWGGPRATSGGVPLVQRRSGGAQWTRSLRREDREAQELAPHGRPPAPA